MNYQLHLLSPADTCQKRSAHQWHFRGRCPGQEGKGECQPSFWFTSAWLSIRATRPDSERCDFMVEEVEVVQLRSRQQHFHKIMPSNIEDLLQTELVQCINSLLTAQHSDPHYQ